MTADHLLDWLFMVFWVHELCGSKLLGCGQADKSVSTLNHVCRHATVGICIEVQESCECCMRCGDQRTNRPLVGVDVDSDDTRGSGSLGSHDDRQTHTPTSEHCHTRPSLYRDSCSDLARPTHPHPNTATLDPAYTETRAVI